MTKAEGAYADIIVVAQQAPAQAGNPIANAGAGGVAQAVNPAVQNDMQNPEMDLFYNGMPCVLPSYTVA